VTTQLPHYEKPKAEPLVWTSGPDTRSLAPWKTSPFLDKTSKRAANMTTLAIKLQPSRSLDLRLARCDNATSSLRETQSRAASLDLRSRYKNLAPWKKSPYLDKTSKRAVNMTTLAIKLQPSQSLNLRLTRCDNTTLSNRATQSRAARLDLRSRYKKPSTSKNKPVSRQDV